MFGKLGSKGLYFLEQVSLSTIGTQYMQGVHNAYKGLYVAVALLG